MISPSSLIATVLQQLHNFYADTKMKKPNIAGSMIRKRANTTSQIGSSKLVIL